MSNNIFDNMSLKNGSLSKSSNVFESMKADKQKKSEALVAGGSAAGLAAAGYGAIKGVKAGIDWYNQPKAERNRLVSEMQQTQADIGAQGRLTQTPKLLKTKITLAGAELKAALDDIDNVSMLKSNEAANTIINKAQSWAEGGYKSYRNGLDSIEGVMQQQGKHLNKSWFKEQFLKGTLTDSIKEGVPEEKMSKLVKLIDSVEAKGQMTITQAKGYFNEIVDDLPVRAKYRAAERWGDFLKNNAPQEVAENLDVLNKNYKQFAEVRNKIFGMIDKDTNTLSPTKLNRFLYNSTRTRLDTGMKELFDFLNKGNDIASKMDGLEDGSKKLLELRVQRDRVLSQAGRKMTELKRLIPKVEQQVENLKIAQSKVDRRSILSGVKIPFIDKPLVSKGLPILGNVAQVLDAGRFAQDPISYMASQDPSSGGRTQEEIMKLRSLYQNSISGNKLSDDDVKQLSQAGVLL